MARLFGVLDRVFIASIGFLCVVFLSVMLVSIFGQVIMRYVFSSPLTWSEELARYSMVWLAMLACAIATRNGEHIVLIAADALPGRLARPLFLVATIVVWCVLALLFWHSWDLAARASRQTVPGLGLSMSLIYASLPVGFALMMLGQLLGLVRRKPSPAARPAGE